MCYNERAMEQGKPEEQEPQLDNLYGELLGSGRWRTFVARAEPVTAVPKLLRTAGELPLRVGDITDLLD